MWCCCVFQLKNNNKPKQTSPCIPIVVWMALLAKEQNKSCFSDFTTGTHSTWEWCHSQPCFQGKLNASLHLESSQNLINFKQRFRNSSANSDLIAAGWLIDWFIWHRCSAKLFSSTKTPVQLKMVAATTYNQQKESGQSLIFLDIK